MKRRRRPDSLGWPEFKLLLASILLGLFLCEIGLRLFAPIPLKRDRYRRTDSLFLNQPGKIPDPVLGTFNAKNSSVTYEGKEFSIQVQLNSEGFRDDEESLQDPQFLFLGDSFCFGWGVERHQTLESVFEAETGLSCLNLGVPGYGNLQELLLLERTLDSHPGWKPSVVWLVHENDLSDNCYGGAPVLAPTLRKVGTEIVLTQPLEPEALSQWIESYQVNVWARWARRLFIVDLCRLSFADPHRHFEQFIEEKCEAADPLPGLGVNPFECIDFLFRRASLEMRNRGFQMVVVYIPCIEEIEGIYPGWPGPRIGHREFLAERFALFSIPYLDLTESLSEEDYFPIDGHWKAPGHRRAAEILRAALATSGSLNLQLTSSAASLVPAGE